MTRRLSYHKGKGGQLTYELNRTNLRVVQGVELGWSEVTTVAVSCLAKTTAQNLRRCRSGNFVRLSLYRRHALA
ncbi:MAG: hypothetical protein MSG64_01055 [Pyrinomonadaceae bacterium MAG19_C2-C3]|nr:hypothetical protein [Pyrinomonadaceae bacterium MAG19_C2-C3]